MSGGRPHGAALLSGNVAHHVLRLGVPMVIGLGSILMFHVVDAYFVGQLGRAELAALSFTFPVSFIVTSVAMGTGVGTVTAVARALGAADRGRAERLTTHALMLVFLLVAGTAGTVLLLLQDLFRLLGASESALPLIREFMVPWLVGVPLLAVPMVGNSALRAGGDAITPSLIMLAATGVNALLDPLLIFGLGPFPALGLQGAAFATVASWVVACAAGVLVLSLRERLLRLRHAISGLRLSALEILHVGLPAAATQALAPLGAAIVTRILATFGEPSVAAFGAATRLEAAALVGVMAVIAGVMPVVGQNHGAGAQQRVLLASRFAVWVALGWGAAVALLFWLTGSNIAYLFSDDARVQELLTQYLVIVPVSYAAFGATHTAAGVLNGVRRPLLATSLIVGRIFVLGVPAAYVGGQLAGSAGVFGGMCAANLASGVMALVALKAYFRRSGAAPPPPAGSQRKKDTWSTPPRE